MEAKLALEGLNILLNYGGPTGVIVLIVILVGINIHSHKVERLIDKFSVGACRGNPEHCLFNIAHAQGNMIRNKFDGLQEYISAQFTKMLIEAIENKDIVATSEEINNAIIHHKHLLAYSFIPAIEETKRIVRENGVPTDLRKREIYIQDKFNGVWGLVWSRYRSDYRHKTLLLPYSKIQEAQEQRMSKYMDFARDTIETGFSIAHNMED